MEDDITASVVVLARRLVGIPGEYDGHPSLKLSENCEFRLFQRPDDAVHRGFDALLVRLREVVQKLTDADVGSLRYFRFWPEQVKVGGVPCWVSKRLRPLPVHSTARS